MKQHQARKLIWINLQYFFSPCVDDIKRRKLNDALGIYAIMKEEKYLGLPLILGKSKNGFFNGIKDRIWKRVQGWKERLLSKAGREILIKSIVQAIPNYAMSCFQFPKFILNEIRSMIANFWSGQRKREKKMHWFDGISFVSPRIREGWAFGNFSVLTKPFWQSKVGELSKTLTLWWPKFLKPDIFQTAVSSKLRRRLIALFCGRVFSQLGMFLIRAVFGELGMDIKSRFGRIIGVMLICFRAKMSQPLLQGLRIRWIH